VAFNEAIKFIQEQERVTWHAHEQELTAYAIKRLSETPHVTLVGTAKNKVSVQSFLINGIHPFDIGQMLDTRGIAVRTGHHCTQPLMDGFGIEGTVRASFAVYNTKTGDRSFHGRNRPRDQVFEIAMGIEEIQNEIINEFSLLDETWR